jgi:hypothetical protein
VTPFNTNIKSFIESAPATTKEHFSDILYEYDFFLELLYSKYIQSYINLESCTGELFGNLISLDFSERAKGFADLQKEVPSPDYAMKKLQEIVDSLN